MWYVLNVYNYFSIDVMDALGFFEQMWIHQILFPYLEYKLQFKQNILMLLLFCLFCFVLVIYVFICP